jgi:hypothetical protein
MTLGMVMLRTPDGRSGGFVIVWRNVLTGQIVPWTANYYCDN